MQKGVKKMKTVWINKTAFDLSPSDLIGAGGEAEIYKIGNQAVKIYHNGILSPQKIEKVINFPKKLPTNVLFPMDLVCDSKNKKIGFTMNFINGGTDVMKLSNKSYRETNQIDNYYVQNVFVSILKTVHELHK